MVGEQSSKKAEISPPTSPPHRYNPLFSKAVHKIVSSTFGLCSCYFLHVSSDRLTFCLFHPPNKRHLPWLSSPLLPTGLPLISFSWHTVSFLHVSPLKRTTWRQGPFLSSSYQQCLSCKCVMNEKMNNYKTI